MSIPFSELTVLVLGAHTGALQFILERFPAPGDYLVARRFREAADGAKGSNQAIAAARLGANVTLLSAVGDDERGHQALTYMQGQGIDASRVLIGHRHPTGFGAGFYLEDGSVMGATFVGATAELTPRYLDQQRDAFTRGVDVFLTSLEIPVATALYGLRLASEANIPLVILNPSPADDLLPQSLPTVDILTPNEPEARLMAGLAPDSEDPVEYVANKVRAAYGVPLVIVTLGSRGCYVQGHGMNHHVPCPTVRSIDTSGAGDCFNSALGLSLASGQDLGSAVRFALQAASFSVTRPDSWSAYPTFEQAMGFQGDDIDGATA